MNNTGKKRSCSKCGEDLKTRYPKYRYCKKCHAEYNKNFRTEDALILKFMIDNASNFSIQDYGTEKQGFAPPTKGRFGLFTVGTQYIYGSTARECIKTAIAYLVQKKLNPKS